MNDTNKVTKLSDLSTRYSQNCWKRGEEMLPLMHLEKIRCQAACRAVHRKDPGHADRSMTWRFAVIYNVSKRILTDALHDKNVFLAVLLNIRLGILTYLLT